MYIATDGIWKVPDEGTDGILRRELLTLKLTTLKYVIL